MPDTTSPSISKVMVFGRKSAELSVSFASASSIDRPLKLMFPIVVQIGIDLPTAKATPAYSTTVRAAIAATHSHFERAVLLSVS